MVERQNGSFSSTVVVRQRASGGLVEHNGGSLQSGDAHSSCYSRALHVIVPSPAAGSRHPLPPPAATTQVLPFLWWWVGESKVKGRVEEGGDRAR